MLEKRSWYITGAKKISKKNSGRPPFWAKRFFGAYWALTTPRVTKGKIFFYQTDKHEVLCQWLHSNIHVLIKSVFYSNYKKKVCKMPNFENGTALSWVSGVMNASLLNLLFSNISIESIIKWISNYIYKIRYIISLMIQKQIIPELLGLILYFTQQGYSQDDCGK